jgi:hypothetical protein
MENLILWHLGFDKDRSWFSLDSDAPANISIDVTALVIATSNSEYNTLALADV